MIHVPRNPLTAFTMHCEAKCPELKNNKSQHLLGFFVVVFAIVAFLTSVCFSLLFSLLNNNLLQLRQKFASKFLLQLLILVEFVILAIKIICYFFYKFLQAISFKSFFAKIVKRNCFQIFVRECNPEHKWLSHQNHDNAKIDHL